MRLLHAVAFSELKLQNVAGFSKQPLRTLVKMKQFSNEKSEK